jgi:release factor glutamine methyltransferase
MLSIKDLVNKLEPKYRNEALLYTAFLYKSDLSYILAHLDKKVSSQKAKDLKKAFSKIQKDYPLAYLTKQKYFYGHLFSLNSKVLIPRPESEEIIDLGLSYASSAKEPLKIIDIGTGPGTLIISLAKEMLKHNRLAYQKAEFLAGDISISALKIAKNNAQSLKIAHKISFKKTNLASAFLADIKKYKGKTIFISANLPYLNKAERAKEISIKYEPNLALIGGGSNGLLLYKLLLKQLASVMQDKKYYLVMEINPHQAKTLITSVREKLPLAKIQKKSDLSGRTRFIIVYQN